MVSSAELHFEAMWVSLFPDLDLETEVRLIPNRRFRFDYVHLQSKVAIEINGGNWISGRHVRPSALLSEYEKLNLAQSLGYHVFLLTPEMITTQWLTKVKDVIQSKIFVVK